MFYGIQCYSIISLNFIVMHSKIDIFMLSPKLEIGSNMN